MSVTLPPALQNLAPATRNAIAVGLGALAVGLLLVFLAILPKQKAIRATQEETRTLSQTLERMRADIGTTDTLKKQCAATQDELDKIIASGVIDPLLGSFAMRGKALLDPVGQETGFAIENVKELPMLPLQLPKEAPEQRHGRQPVEFTGQGSYQQIAAFIAKAEAAQPLLTLSSLAILAQQQTPETQRAVIVFEWPAKGEKIKPAAPAKKTGKK